MSGVIQIHENKSMLKWLLISVLLITFTTLYAQTDKKFIRKGNKEYNKSKYSDSEISFRKAIDKNKQSPDAVFNVGDALYKQDKFEEAGKQFVESTNENDDRIKKSSGLYNLGNSLLKANKLQESIEAYKNSLKLHPDNREAKYNLAYAQDLLKIQQEQQKKQQQDKQDQNKDKKKEDQKKDQKDKNDKNKDQQKEQKDNQDQKQQQPQKQEISKEDAQRLLNSLANDEKNVQEKVKLAKASKTKVRTVKNW
ncbi:MAG TPA: tetratricopeptide repeat protein [Bacteroidales bacterium]